MTDYPKSKPTSPPAPDMPATCSEPGCFGETIVSVVWVRYPDGRKACRWPPEVIRQGELAPGCEFIRWVTRCSDHARRDVDQAHERGTYRTPNGNTVRAHGATLSELRDAARQRGIRGKPQDMSSNDWGRENLDLMRRLSGGVIHRIPMPQSSDYDEENHDVG